MWKGLGIEIGEAEEMQVVSESVLGHGDWRASGKNSDC
jgi:hypothetical protein